MQTDVWAITPAAANTTYYRAAASLTGAAVLLKDEASLNGCGYLVSITSSGNDSVRTFIIVGYKVGDLTGRTTTETVTGPNITTVTSTNYYSRLVSVTCMNGASVGTSVGSISLGIAGSLALPRCRIKGGWVLGAASAGTLIVNSNTTSGTQILRLDTPASSGAAVFSFNFGAYSEGILTARSNSTDFAIVTLSNIPTYTLICG